MDWLDIPIFISSTFNDMHAERDYLVKNVFPELAEWCEKRKLRLIDIDLRWGVTSEDAESKNVVKKCLESIDSCRPFFLCFLGQRRGWVPNDPVRLAYEKEHQIGGHGEDELGDTSEKYDDVNGFFGKKSVTEIEIEHALLAPMYRIFDKVRPEATKHALFFFRNEPKNENWDAPHRRLYRNEGVLSEGGDVEETNHALESFKGEVRAERREHVIDYDCRWDATAAANVPELLPPKKKGVQLTPKDLDRIEQSNGRLVDFAVPRNALPKKVVEQLEKVYPDIAIGQTIPLKYVVIAGLIQEILCRYPLRENACAADDDIFVRDFEQQDIFINNAAESFVPVPSVLEQLDNYIRSDSMRPLILSAGAGLGKTTLLAQWVKTQRKAEKAVIARFCGASDLASEQYSLWDSILRERNIQTPTTFDELQKKIRHLMWEYSEQGESIIVIDAIDQLPDGISMLSWIPPELPANLKLIISMKWQSNVPLQVNGVTHDDLVTLKPIDEDQKRELVSAYLAKNLKQLDKKHIDVICGTTEKDGQYIVTDKVQSEASANPLYLKILVSELRQFGSFELLGEQIKKYGKNPIEAFDHVLENLENERAYDVIASAVSVPLLFGLLSCARRGLSEHELVFCFQRAFGKNAPLYETVRYFLRRVRPFMARRGGRVDFLYDSFREAVSRRYADLCKKHHKVLADCFREICDPHQNNSFDSDNMRALAELGHHTTEFDTAAGELLYSSLPYLDARCSITPMQSLIVELSRFESEVCRNFFNIILRNQAILSNYPNTLFSICHAEQPSLAHEQANKLLSNRSWTKAWLDTESLFTLQDIQADADETPPSMALKIIAESERYVFTSACAFSADAAIFAFSETLERLRVFDTTAFELLSCIIHVRPVRTVSIQISPTCEHLAVAHEDATIELFRLVYNQEGQLWQAAKINQEIKTYKPRCGFSAFGFSGDYVYYQSDANTIRVFDMNTATSVELFQAEQPIILDALIPFGNSMMFVTRQRMYSSIYRNSPANKNIDIVSRLDSVFVRCAHVIDEEYFGVAFSDERIVVLNTTGNIVAERKMESAVKTLCCMGQKLLVLCHNDELILWDWIENSANVIGIEKGSNQHLNMLSVSDNNVMTILGASVAKYELASGHVYKSAKVQIVSMGEVPELTAAVRDSKNGVSIQQSGFRSETTRLEDDIAEYSIHLTKEGTYLFSEFGQGRYLAPGHTSFQPLRHAEKGQPVRILKSFATADGCVYCIDVLWSMNCGQSSFSYDLSPYRLQFINIRVFGEYVLIFGKSDSEKSMHSAATGHISFDNILLIFQAIRPGMLRFCGERLFSSLYGKPMDAAFHEKTQQFYLLFNTPHTARKKDLLHVWHGTKEELIAGRGCHTDINVSRKGDNLCTSACAGDSYLVCYQGSIFSFDAATLEYRAAIAANGSFDRLQAALINGAYALALCNNATEIKQITPKQEMRGIPNDES